MQKGLLRTIFIVLFLLPHYGTAHVPNQSYIFLRIYENDGIEGRFEINTRDINKIFPTHFHKGVIAKDLDPFLDELKKYLMKNTAFASEFGPHDIVLKDSIAIVPGTLGDYVNIYFTLNNTKKLPQDLTVNYSAIFEKDETHRGFLITEYNWKAGVINDEMNITLDFAPGDTQDTMSLTEVSVWRGFIAMVKQGVWHIWIGLDHILFLLALILPAVVRRKKDKTGIGHWEAVHEFKPAFLYILKVITFFTIAHTITLSLASLKIIVLPSQLVESVIAISIGLAAFNNILPIFRGEDWLIAFGFGLFHGFGFASVLGDLGLTHEFLTLSLLGFNVGVELGQMVIIALIFPVLFILRKSKVYPKILVYGSILLIIVSLNWSIERAFDIDLGVYEFAKSKVRAVLVFLGLW